MYLEVNGPERSYNCFYGSIYVCIHCTRKVYSLQLTAYLQMFVKSKHCTGYPLIQVEIVSVYALYALAGLPKFFVDFLVPGVCGCSWTISSVGAGAGTGAGPPAGASSAISAISAFSSFLSEKYRIRLRRSIWCCHVDKVR